MPSHDEDEETDRDEDEQDDDETYCDENRSYGILLSLRGDNLVLESGLMCDLSGDAEVEIVKDAGLGRVDV